MTPAAIALSLLELIARVLPGALAIWFSKPTDAEALAHARERIAAIPLHPAADAIDDEVRRAQAEVVETPHMDAASRPVKP